jgi:hypothetical protein
VKAGLGIFMYVTGIGNCHSWGLDVTMRLRLSSAFVPRAHDSIASIRARADDKERGLGQIIRAFLNALFK